MPTTQRPESHGLGQNFEGWAGSMCPQETPGVLSAHAFFALGTVPIMSKPAHWILLLLLLNMGSLSKMVRFSLYPCLWVSEPLPLVEVLPELNHFDKYLIVALIIRYFR